METRNYLIDENTVGCLESFCDLLCRYVWLNNDEDIKSRLGRSGFLLLLRQKILEMTASFS
jgi:hypothetical protein